MSETPAAHPFVTPGAITTALSGFVFGGVALGFDPFFAPSVIAFVFCAMALRSASDVDHFVIQGLLRIFAILGIMGAAGGIVVQLFPGLGVHS